MKQTVSALRCQTMTGYRTRKNVATAVLWQLARSPRLMQCPGKVRLALRWRYSHENQLHTRVISVKVTSEDYHEHLKSSVAKYRINPKAHAYIKLDLTATARTSPKGCSSERGTNTFPCFLTYILPIPSATSIDFTPWPTVAVEELAILGIC